MRNKLWGWGLMVVAGLALWVTYCADPAPTPENSALVDSLTAVNAEMMAQAQASAIREAALVAQRDSARAVRDRMKRTSDSTTAELRALRASLPPADQAPVADLPRLYASALSQLDQAHAELVRKDSIIAADNLDRIESDSIEKELREQKALYQGLYANEQVISADWKKKYGDELARRPRCGKKCGIVIGVVSTVGVAVGLQQVHKALNPKR